MSVRPLRTGHRRGGPDDAPPAAVRLLEALPLPAALLRRGRVVALNPAWLEAATPAGLVSTRDGVGQDHLTVLEQEKGFAHDAGQAVASIVRAAMAGGHHETDYDLEDESGRRVWRARADPVELDEEEYVLLTHQEVTQREQVDRLARRLADTGVELRRAQAVAQDRASILHAAMQEFHGPITPINLELHLLRSGGLGDLNERQRTALERVQRNVRKWWNLQENLLGNLQGLERTDEQPRLIDLRSILDEAVPPFQDRSIASGIRLRVEKPEHPLPVEVTPRAFVQVLMMLVDHALRVTSSGGQVWIRARAVGDHAEVSIHDQDPAMEPRIAQHLLDRNELVTDPEDEGHTLRAGLLYADSVVTRIGGRLEVASSGAGQGLEVVLSLPQSL